MRYLVDLPNRLYGAENLEDILCLSVLIANKVISPVSDIAVSRDYYENEVGSDCGKCSFANICLACIINE